MDVRNSIREGKWRKDVYERRSARGRDLGRDKYGRVKVN